MQNLYLILFLPFLLSFFLFQDVAALEITSNTVYSDNVTISPEETVTISAILKVINPKGIVTNEGTIIINAGGELAAEGSSKIINKGTITINKLGRLTGFQAGLIYNEGTIKNTGTIIIGTNSKMNNINIMENHGQIKINCQASGFENAGLITNWEDGKIHNNSVFNNTGQITNYGEFESKDIPSGEDIPCGTMTINTGTIINEKNSKFVVEEYTGNPTKDGGGCLIATAAFGSELAPQVQFLREIRDNTVMTTSSGASFMTGFNTLYYSFAPTVADWERENPMFKEAVRSFITPMISTLSIMALADEDSEVEVLGLGISIIALNLGMYIAAPALIGFKVHKQIKSRK